MYIAILTTVVFAIAFLSKKGRLKDIYSHHGKMMAEHNLDVQIQHYRNWIADCALSERKIVELEGRRIKEYARKYTNKFDKTEQKIDGIIASWELNRTTRLVFC